MAVKQKFAAIEALRPAIATGVEWLVSEQPPDAAIFHFGVNHITDTYYLQVAPFDAHGNPLFNVGRRNLERTGTAERRYIVNPVTKAEALAFKSLVAEFALVKSMWHSEEFISVNLLRRASASVENLFGNYKKGCPVHPGGSVFCPCDWLDIQRARLILPPQWSS